MQLFLIRHGETEWSRNGRHTGRTDVPLTAAGEDEARALAPALAGVRFTRVVTSPRQRARRTCELSGLGTLAAVEPDLAEWDYGAYEGLRSAEIHAERPDWSVFRDGCPGGESPAQAAARADRLLAGLRAGGGTIALFSHGHFGSVLAVRWIGLPVLEGRHFWLRTGALNVLGTHPSHPDVPIIARWNNVPGAP